MIFNFDGREDKSAASSVVGEPTLEAVSLIMESFIREHASEEELEAFLESSTEVNAAIHEEVLLEKTIVRFDKQAKINQQAKVAVFTIAKEKNDPLFKKLLTVWRMERYLEEKLVKKYGNEGTRRAKQIVAKNMNSRSKLVSNVSKKVKKQMGTK